MTPRRLALLVPIACLLVALPALGAQVPPAPPAAPALDLTTLIKLVTGHQWLPVAALILLYARFAVSNASKFPITIPPTWLPVVSGVVTAAFTAVVAVQSGTSVGLAIVGLATTGVIATLLDAFAVAVFGNDPSKVPWYMRFVLMLAHDVAGGGNAAKRGMVRGELLLGLVASSLLVVSIATGTGCNGRPVVPTAETVVGVIFADFEAGKTQQQIEADACAVLGGTSLEDVACRDVTQLVVDVLQSLLAGGKLSPAATERAKVYVAAHAGSSR